MAFWDLTNRQDWHVCEQMQLGLFVAEPIAPGRILPARAFFSGSTGSSSNTSETAGHGETRES